MNVHISVLNGMELIFCLIVTGMFLLVSGCVSQYHQVALSENEEIGLFENENLKNITSVLQEPENPFPQENVLRKTPREVPIGFLF